MEIREALNAAIDAAEKDTTTETTAPAPEAPTTTPAPVADVPAEAKADAAPSLPREGRDEKGRFASKPKDAAPLGTKAPATTTPPAPGTQTTTPPAPAETSATLKAPQSWKPAAREKWASLPAETQAEVWRREREVQHVLQETAQARKLAESFDSTIRPYVPLFQAEGAEPLKAIGNMLQTVSVLARGQPQHKAQVVAQLVKAYGVDIAALDDALSGQAPKAAAPQEFRDPRFDTLMQHLQSQQSQRAEMERQKAFREVESAAAEMEFLDDVRDDMADLMEVAARRGVELSLKDAYSRAVAMNPELSGILKQRDAAKAAETANAATQRTKAAASSVRNNPAPSSREGPGDSIREHLEAAFAAHKR